MSDWLDQEESLVTRLRKVNELLTNQSDRDSNTISELQIANRSLQVLHAKLMLQSMSLEERREALDNQYRFDAPESVIRELRAVLIEVHNMNNKRYLAS